MTDNGRTAPPPDRVLDELVSHLLDCGSLVAQIVDHMTRFHAAGHSAPDALPIPVVLHGLLSDILGPIVEGHHRSDVETVVAMFDEITSAIADEILLVPIEDPNCADGQV